jgi:hypothetical protein
MAVSAGWYDGAQQTQTTAWKIKHKLMQAMMERDATKRLTGRIEVDDAYLGGGRGRNHPARQANPLAVAPRQGFPPRRDDCLGDAQFRSRQHRRQ